MAVSIRYTTESGDEGDIGVFERAPTRAEKVALIRQHLSSELVEDSDGSIVSYAVLHVTELTLPQPLPAPDPEADKVEFI